MRKAIIFGAGGHARVIASMLSNKVSDILFVDQQARGTDVLEEAQILRDIDQYRNCDFYIGLGSNKLRSNIFGVLLDLEIYPSNCIADNAFVARDAELGQGVVICPGGVVGSRASIGNNTIINTLASVDHDCNLGEHSQIAPGVNFCGGVSTGMNTFFGVKSAVVPNINIGDNSVIMAGSLVHKDVPANVMVGGVPARQVKRL